MTKKCDKKKKRNVRSSLDETSNETSKEIQKECDKKRKRNVRSSLDETSKENEKECAKKRMRNVRSSLDETSKERVKTKDRSRKGLAREITKDKRREFFDAVKHHSMVDPCILQTGAFKLIYNEYKDAINEGPTYICDICWKFEFRKNIIKLDSLRYQSSIFNECSTGKSNWICNSCHKTLLKRKMPVQAQANDLKLCPKIKELDILCRLELRLISQIIPFMAISSRARAKSGQCGLKGQCVLVPADIKKIQKVLPRTNNKEYLISLALKRRLSDSNTVDSQMIRPALVNRALEKLQEINPFYKNVLIKDDWEDVTQKSDPELWNILTNDTENSENDVEDNETKNDYLTDSDDDNEDIDFSMNKRKHKMAPSIFPTVMQNKDGPHVSVNEMINIAPGEGKIPVSFTSEPDWEALAFVKEYSTGKNHFNTKRKIPISVSKYIHARLKSCDDRFASNPQYIFHCVDWVEKTAIASSIHFAERKRYQREINAGQLRSQDGLREMIGSDVIYASFKNIRGTPQYFHNMSLDILAKYRQYGKPTIFLTGSAAEFEWTELIKVVGRQYGETLSDDDIKNMDRHTKCQYFKRNPVTVARQIDHIFSQLWGKVILSGMHPLGQILNYDDRSEFAQRGIEHFHAILHVVDAPVIDKDPDEKVIEYIDNHITCQKPDDAELCKEVEAKLTHKHTFTCRKKKGVTCRFNAPWPVSSKTIIARRKETANIDHVKQKKILDRVLSTVNDLIKEYGDLSKVTEEELLQKSNVKKDEYYEVLSQTEKDVTIVYKRNPCDTLIGPYNTVIFSCLRANMNVQYITSIYALLTYLTTYLCKPERQMGELMRKASKEAYGKDIKSKMQPIANILANQREMSIHEGIKRAISLRYRRSNNDVIFVPTGFKKDRVRMIKHHSILDTLHPDDPDVYAPNLLDKYEHRPDKLENMCYADFAAAYVTDHKKSLDSEDIMNYTTNNVAEIEENLNEKCITITLKDRFGKMKKRSKACIIRFRPISKDKNSEQYYFQKLQLYFPWRNEDELLNFDQTYKSRYEEVESQILDNINRHEPFANIDIEELPEPYEREESEEEDNISDDFAMFDPSLIDLDETSEVSHSHPTAHASVETVLMENDTFYQLCSQMNKKQQQLFNFIMQYAIRCRYAEKNDTLKPSAFYVFLSGGAGVGKSFLINIITEYLRRMLRYPSQALDQQSVLVTASTGKAATNVNGTTLHSAFQLQIRISGRPFHYIKAGNERLHILRNKYRFLKVLIIDEISMVGNETFHHLDLRLQDIMDNKLPFGGISVLVVGDLLQLNPVKQQGVFMLPNKGTYEAFQGSVWRNLFLLHELTEIVRQISDPQFAEILARLREGEHTKEDVGEIKKLVYTDTSKWPSQFVKLFLTNYLVNKENEEVIRKLGADEMYTIKAEDTARDVENKKYDIKIDKKTSLSDTGNLPTEITVCVGARFMLTENLDISEKLINGSIGTVKRLCITDRNPLLGTIYVKFDDEKAGTSLKNRRLRGELKECIPIKAMIKPFPYYRGKSRVTVQRKQYPGILAHAITIHKSQGSTLEYMLGDLNRKTGDDSNYKAPVLEGQFYTLLSRAKCRDKIKVINFEERHIKVNKRALEEMKRMRQESVFEWQHPLQTLKGNKVCLFNIRSWNAHINHFLSDSTYTELADILCFTETHVNGDCTNEISTYQDGWLDFHKPTEHGLAICYNTKTVKIIKQFDTLTNIEILPVLLQIKKDEFLIVLVYRTGPLKNFLQNLRVELDNLPTSKKTLIMGDFNIDQMLPENVIKLQPILQRFNLIQRSTYTTHNLGGILDLVLDNNIILEKLQWLPSPFSDHFIIFISI